MVDRHDGRGRDVTLALMAVNQFDDRLVADPRLTVVGEPFAGEVTDDGRIIGRTVEEVVSADSPVPHGVGASVAGFEEKHL